jgi:hypothetical protein
MSLTLGEVVEKFCLRQFNDKRKGYLNYLSFAKDIWQQLLLRTLWVYQTRYVHVRQGDPYPYFDLPEAAGFVLGVYYESCGQLVPVSDNPHYNIEVRPLVKNCGCGAEGCDCGALCSGVASMQVVEKEVEIDGALYVQRTWYEGCKNGDLLEWSETPTLDYSQEPAVVTVHRSQQWKCKLDVKPCGCVSDTDTNRKLLSEHCGCHTPPVCRSGLLQGQIVHTEKPVVKREGRRFFIISGVRESFVVRFQPTCGVATSPVPFFCERAIMAGIDYEAKIFNPTVDPNQVERARLAFKRECAGIIEYLNPINLETLAEIERQPNQW